jgi:hypothetical protein
MRYAYPAIHIYCILPHMLHASHIFSISIQYIQDIHFQSTPPRPRRLWSPAEPGRGGVLVLAGLGTWHFIAVADISATTQKPTGTCNGGAAAACAMALKSASNGRQKHHTQAAWSSRVLRAGVERKVLASGIHMGG